MSILTLPHCLLLCNTSLFSRHTGRRWTPSRLLTSPPLPAAILFVHMLYSDKETMFSKDHMQSKFRMNMRRSFFQRFQWNFPLLELKTLTSSKYLMTTMSHVHEFTASLKGQDHDKVKWGQEFFVFFSWENFGANSPSFYSFSPSNRSQPDRLGFAPVVFRPSWWQFGHYLGAVYCIYYLTCHPGGAVAHWGLTGASADMEHSHIFLFAEICFLACSHRAVQEKLERMAVVSTVTAINSNRHNRALEQSGCFPLYQDPLWEQLCMNSFACY